jgi:adenylate cyclase class 2
VNGDRIEDQEEICLTVNDFDAAVEFLTCVGAERKAYQETKRELWSLGGADVTIDEWPFLEPFVEVEGASEAAVRAASERIGFDYATALFCSVDTLYARKYGFAEDVFNNHAELVVFDMENPFLK